jgi:hypothetical protein
MPSEVRGEAIVSFRTLLTVPNSRVRYFALNNPRFRLSPGTCKVLLQLGRSNRLRTIHLLCDCSVPRPNETNGMRKDSRWQTHSMTKKSTGCSSVAPKNTNPILDGEPGWGSRGDRSQALLKQGMTTGWPYSLPGARYATRLSLALEISSAPVFSRMALARAIQSWLSACTERSIPPFLSRVS